MEIAYYPVTIIIIVVTVIVSIQAFNSPDIKYKYLFYPYKVKQNNEHLRFITHLFIHGDYMHLFFNMFVLFSFGRMMEINFHMEFGQVLGTIHFSTLYLAGGFAAALWPFYRNFNNPNYMSLGASGAVSAVLFSAILWNPSAGIYVMFIPMEIPAWIFGILYLGFEYYMSRKGAGTGIAHDAHFGGAIFGIMYCLIIDFEKGKEFINYIIA